MLAVDEGAQTPESKEQPDVDPDATPDCQVDSKSPCLSSLSANAVWCHHLRQEPGALVAHAGICAGGGG
jgi:hypothetical protein